MALSAASPSFAFPVAQWTVALAADANQATFANIDEAAPTLTGSPTSPTYQWALLDPTQTDRVALFSGTSTDADPGTWTPDMAGVWTASCAVTVAGTAQTATRSVAVANVWTTLNVGHSGDFTQDTNNTVTASDSAAGTFTVGDATSTSPQGRYRTGIILPGFDATKTQTLFFRHTWVTQPANESLVYHEVMILDGTSGAPVNADIEIGGGVYYGGTNPNGARIQSATADGTSGTATYASVAGYSGAIRMIQGGIQLVTAQLVDSSGDFLAGSTSNYTPGTLTITGTAHIAVMAGMETSGAGAQACEGTTEWYLHTLPT